MSNVDFGNPHDSHRSLRPNHSYGPSPWGYGCHGWGYPRYGGGGALLMGYMLGRAAQNNQRPQVVYTNVPSPQTYPNYPPQAQYHYHYNSQPPGQYPPPSQVQGYPPPPGGRLHLWTLFPFPLTSHNHRFYGVTRGFTRLNMKTK